MRSSGPHGKHVGGVYPDTAEVTEVVQPRPTLPARATYAWLQTSATAVLFHVQFASPQNTY